MQATGKNGAVALQGQAQQDRRNWQPARGGACLLRSNLPPGKPEELWKTCIQLTEAETESRVLKGPLSVRPIFHQPERRSQVHILVPLPGYALWVTLKHLLRRKGSTLSPAKALELLSTLVSADLVLPTTDGREIRLRRVATPNVEQKQPLDQLAIAVPDRRGFDHQCSVDMATA
ncbi:MAG: hypothetical protein WAO35_17275 [Terriglobia bacterium]